MDVVCRSLKDTLRQDSEHCRLHEFVKGKVRAGTLASCRQEPHLTPLDSFLHRRYKGLRDKWEGFWSKQDKSMTHVTWPLCGIVVKESTIDLLNL